MTSLWLLVRICAFVCIARRGWTGFQTCTEVSSSNKVPLQTRGRYVGGGFSVVRESGGRVGCLGKAVVVFGWSDLVRVLSSTSCMCLTMRRGLERYLDGA